MLIWIHCDIKLITGLILLLFVQKVFFYYIINMQNFAMTDEFKINSGLGAVCCLGKDSINIEFSLMRWPTPAESIPL